MRQLFAISLAALALVCFVRADEKQKDKKEEKVIKTDSGLQYVDLVEGKGERARSGDRCEHQPAGSARAPPVADYGAQL